MPTEVETQKKKFVPDNTDKATQWATKVFSDWSVARQAAGKEAPPKDVLLTEDKKLLCDSLCTFFLEVRKSDGEPYCPRSLAALLAGLHRHIQLNSLHKIQIQRQEEFEPLHTLLDNVYRKLHSEGIGTKKTQASVITLEEEQQLWVTSSSTPEGLLNAL